MEVYQEEWREVFTIAAEVYLFGALIYLILADSKKQWWADGTDTSRHNIEVKLYQSAQYGGSISQIYLTKLLYALESKAFYTCVLPYTQ